MTGSDLSSILQTSFHSVFWDAKGPTLSIIREQSMLLAGNRVSTHSLNKTKDEQRLADSKLKALLEQAKVKAAKDDAEYVPPTKKRSTKAATADAVAELESTTTPSKRRKAVTAASTSADAPTPDSPTKHIISASLQSGQH